MTEPEKDLSAAAKAMGAKGNAVWKERARAARTGKKGKPGRPVRSNLKKAKHVLSSRGIEGLDKRSLLWQSIKELSQEIQGDYGEERISASKRTVLENCLRGQALLEHIDGFLFSEIEAGRNLFNKKRRAAYSLVEVRMRMADTLARQFQLLGLERVKLTTSVREILAGEGGAADDSDGVRGGGGEGAPLSADTSSGGTLPPSREPTPAQIERVEAELLRHSDSSSDPTSETSYPPESRDGPHRSSGANPENAENSAVN